MRNVKIILGLTILISFTSNAQIAKGNWMMGGSGNFGSFNTTSLGVNNKGTYLNLNPNVAYFFIDNLAIGANARLNIYSQTSEAIGFGPYARYYFLKNDKLLNIFSELSYSIFEGTGKGDFKFKTLNIKAGTVYFLNSSVGIEAALNYSNEKSNFDYHSNNIFLSIGFQIHLERER